MTFQLSDKQRELQMRIREFAQREIAPVAAKYDEEETFPRELFRKMGEEGILALMLPEAQGGKEMSCVDFCIAGEEISAACGAVSLSMGAHAVLCAHNLARNGTPEQKAKYLPKLGSGEWIGALAMTEPQSGSDVLSLATRAEKRGGSWILNGTKTYITNAAVADVILLYARTSEELGPHGISAFLVETRTPGFRIDHTFKKMGMRASPTSQFSMTNVEIPEENLLGVENGGLAILMSGLDVERATGGSLGVGIARGAYELALHHARRRRQFKKPVIKYQMIGSMLADMYMQIEAARLLTFNAAAKCDSGQRATLEASMAKLYAAEIAEKVTMDAIQIHGGHGYMRMAGVEKYARDAKLLTIGGGTSQIQKMIIIKHLTGEWGTVDVATEPRLFMPSEGPADPWIQEVDEPAHSAN
ncbi:MAG: acyl-CoA dehydrogenase family protein [Candidatus Hydrogenedentes bacterium]|nr:acyl-CoA dehydrogenase family protein [Candidatus Hydrogenedentota bacterium]